jgi:hypothetical protein
MKKLSKFKRWLSIRKKLLAVDAVSEEIVFALPQYAIKSFPSLTQLAHATRDF